MAGEEIDNITRVKNTYTFDEAIEYMKMKDKEITTPSQPIRWCDVKTGEEVVIGYNMK